jgi:uncharacterized membrane protein
VLHLVHPALVHFTVAFLVAGALLEAWGVLLHRPATARWGGALTVAGTIAMVPTIAAGYLAANSLEIAEDAKRLLDRHESLGLMLLGACLAVALGRAWTRGRIEGGARAPYALGLIAVAGLAATAAYYGGRLVYVFAVGVAR